MNELPLVTFWTTDSQVTQLEIVLDFLEEGGEEVYEPLKELIHAFVKAGECGAYSLREILTTHSKLILIPSSYKVSPRSFSCSLQADYVDFKAFQILRNMLARWGEEFLCVNRVTVKEIGKSDWYQRELPLPDDNNEEEVYPEISFQLTFTTEWVNMEFSKMRRCLVESKYSLEPLEVTGIASIVNLWGDILEKGGFAMPVGLPQEIVSFMGFTSQFDEVTVEIGVDRFLATEMAWNILFNLLDFYNRANGSKLHHVSVE